MLIDLRKHAAAAVFDCDIAIVGAGAAGLTLARHLTGRGRDIVVVESGGLDFDTATQGLADGLNLGDACYPLVHSRLRFFGGTTNVWGGRCARLEAIDFKQRDWVPLSGWPFAPAEMERWYVAAASDVELGPDAASPDGWNGDQAARLGVDPAAFVTRLWHFDDVAERFAPPRAASRAALRAGLRRRRECTPAARVLHNRAPWHRQCA
jgi:choline dehydrogenase-like flavoprotein